MGTSPVSAAANYLGALGMVRWKRIDGVVVSDGHRLKVVLGN